MAREFRLLSVLGLVVACLAVAATTSTEAPEETTATEPTTTTQTPTTTTTVAAGVTTTKAPTTTTTVAAGVTTTKAPTTTTTVAAGVTTTKAPTTTTTVAAGVTTTKAPTTTTTVAAGVTTTKAPTTTTTVAAGVTTTKAPTTTTTVAAGVTTTKAPTTTTTVAAGVTTTKAPTTTTTVGTGVTTTKGPTTTTTVGTGDTTTKGPTTTTTVGTGDTTTTADQTNTITGSVGQSTTQLVPTTTPDPCGVKSCPHGSTCEPRIDQTFTCLCLAGKYNSKSGTCESAKVFPGKVNMPGFKFHESMTVKTSREFHEASQGITIELQRVFKDTVGYSGSIVLEIRKLSKGSIFWSRIDGGSADVEIFFTANTEISSAEVTEKIENEKTCTSCLLAGGTFDGTTLCVKKLCESETTTCVSGNGSFSCNCLDGYIKTDFSDRVCIACPSGKMAVGSQTCDDCSFGFSGFNCSESWKLALVIVGTVLGGLLLITLILLPILLRKSSKKSSKNKSDTEKSYNSHLPAKAPLVNNGLANGKAASVNGPANGMSAFVNAGVPRIPRATSTNSWDSRTNLEMAPSNSRQNLIPMGRNPRLYDDHDDMNPYAQARPQSSLYAQARPQNNPYAQNRPQTNPYDQSQGHSNPHYVHDNGRRFN